MTAYQAGLAKFEEAGARVFAISTDNSPSQKEFAEKVKATFPFLSDFSKREVSKAYGVLIEPAGMANRATFVLDADGKILSIEEGRSAVDPTGAVTACSRAAHKDAPK
jgi:peroxiredoxin